MVKLNNNEIQDMIEHETSYVDKTSSYNNIPSDACSKFYFEIKENIEDLVYEMTKKSKKHYPQERYIDIDTGEVHHYNGERIINYILLNYEKNENGATYELHDPDFYSYATVKEENDKITINTALSGYEYVITQSEYTNGCIVEFSGPLNGLLAQNLLPKMTYIPHSLKGKFITAEMGEGVPYWRNKIVNERDLTPYMPIDLYCALREMKNSKNPNLQDGYGWRINAFFNNEIPCFAKYHYYSEQDRKNYSAQLNFEDNCKMREFDITRKKEEIRKRIEQHKKLALEIRKGIDKATPIKNVTTDMIFNISKDR